MTWDAKTRVLRYPNPEALNARIRQLEGTPNQVFVSFVEVSGRVESMGYARHWVQGQAILARPGPLHSHDVGAHLPGFLLLPRELVEASRRKLTLLFALADDPVLGHNKLLNMHVRSHIDAVGSSIDVASAMWGTALGDGDGMIRDYQDDHLVLMGQNASALSDIFEMDDLSEDEHAHLRVLLEQASPVGVTRERIRQLYGLTRQRLESEEAVARRKTSPAAPRAEGGLEENRSVLYPREGRKLVIGPMALPDVQDTVPPDRPASSESLGIMEERVMEIPADQAIWVIGGAIAEYASVAKQVTLVIAPGSQLQDEAYQYIHQLAQQHGVALTLVQLDVVDHAPGYSQFAALLEAYRQQGPSENYRLRSFSGSGPQVQGRIVASDLVDPETITPEVQDRIAAKALLAISNVEVLDMLALGALASFETGLVRFLAEVIEEHAAIGNAGSSIVEPLEHLRAVVEETRGAVNPTGDFTANIAVLAASLGGSLAQLKASPAKGGLEEGVQVRSVEAVMAYVDLELVPTLQRLQGKGHAQLVLVPVDRGPAAPDSSGLKLYADASVAGWAQQMAPKAQFVELSDTPDVLILDAAIQHQLPESHPLALFVNPGQRPDDAVVQALLAQARMLDGRAIDLAGGPIGTVVINDRKYAIYA